MYTYGITSNRCSLCYALLSANTKPTSSTISYSSSVSRRHANRSMTQSLEKLISSSRKFQNLWRKNENGLVNHRSICYRCCDTVEKIEDIKSNIEKLNIQQDTLVNKIEHYLHKRALILQAQRQRTNSFSSSIYQHQSIPIDEDDDTEEGEEKPRTVMPINGHRTSNPLPISSLVGAKRRKCNIAHKINLEEKSSLLLNHTKAPNSAGSKFSPSLLFGSHNPKHLLSPAFNGHAHDLASLSFGAAYKSLNLPASAATTPPFIDPTTGALIAIVSNPHHAALLAQQHQQMLQSSSISPSSSTTNDEHEHLTVKANSTPSTSTHPKKFPCLLCGRDFSNKSNLNRHHSIVHVAIRNFECARCPKKFKLRQGLKTHMQRCHGVNTDEPTFVLQKHSTHHPLYQQSAFAQSK